MKYFAYGSNMSSARIKARVPSAEPLGVYVLAAHTLRFHKRSVDGSGKCDAFYTGLSSDKVYGVLFNIALDEKPYLDQVEGVEKGDEVKDVELHIPSQPGQRQTAFMYYATDIAPTAVPYSWYAHHVIAGAQEFLLPEWYIRNIQAIECKTDTDVTRQTLELAIYNTGNRP